MAITNSSPCLEMLGHLISDTNHFLDCTQSVFMPVAIQTLGYLVSTAGAEELYFSAHVYQGSERRLFGL